MTIYLLIIHYFTSEIGMWLNKKNTTNSEIKWQSENESQRKANLTQNFSESKNSELIEKEYEALPKMIENLNLPITIPAPMMEFVPGIARITLSVASQ